MPNQQQCWLMASMHRTSAEVWYASSNHPKPQPDVEAHSRNFHVKLAANGVLIPAASLIIHTHCITQVEVSRHQFKCPLAAGHTHCRPRNFQY